MNDEFKPPYDWKLLRRKEKEIEGLRIFYEQWVHEKSKSGIVCLTYPLQGRIRYLVEGYGISTINPEDFSPRGDAAPVQQSEHDDETEARRTLCRMMKETYELWIDSNEGRRGKPLPPTRVYGPFGTVEDALLAAYAEKLASKEADE